MTHRPSLLLKNKQQLSGASKQASFTLALANSLFFVFQIHDTGRMLTLAFGLATAWSSFVIRAHRMAAD